ncbi:energy transducer TonB [Spirosoma lituiforme]
MSTGFFQPLFILPLVATVSVFTHTTGLGQTNNQHRQVDTTAYAVVQVPPEFPGGPDAMFQFIQSTSLYPISLTKGSLMVVRLLVEKDGSISNVQITHADVANELIVEAKRIINRMPKWKPGSQDGQLLRAYTSVPIRFLKAK